MKVELGLVNLQALNSGVEKTKRKENVGFTSDVKADYGRISVAQSEAIKNLSNVQKVSQKPQVGLSTVISFTGAAKNPKEVLHVAPEGALCKGGGVATVMDDWARAFPEFGAKDVQHSIVIPYYNGDIIPFSDGGGIRELKIAELKGKKYFVNSTTDLGLIGKDEAALKEALNKTIFELEEVVSGNMRQFNDATMDVADQSYTLLEAKGLPTEWLGKNGKPTKIYTMFTPQTGSMPKQYGFSYKNGEMYEAYSEFARAVTHSMPGLTAKTGFNPANIVVHDYHGNATLKFIQDGALSGAEDDYYKGLRLGYIFHNAGKGYQGDEVSPQALFRAIATPEEYQKVVKSKQYQEIMTGSSKTREQNLNQFFAKLMPDLCEKAADGTTTTKLNPSLVPIRLAERGYVKMATVSQEYAREIGTIPEMSRGLTTELKNLYENKTLLGIGNGLFRPNEANQIGKGNESYMASTVDNMGLTYKDGAKVLGMRTFDPQNVTLENVGDVIKVKQDNKYNFLERLIKYKDVDIQDAKWKKGAISLVTGDLDRDAKITSTLNADTLKNLQANPDTPLFVSWGRGDFQKSFDEILAGIKKYVTSSNDDGKSIFVICGGLDNTNPESAIVKRYIDDLMSIDKLKGRFAFIDGWGPAHAMASAADWSIFPSRTAPFELTPLEAQIRGSLTIASNTGGLSQTTISLAENAQQATGIKTASKYYMAQTDIESHAQYGDKFKKELEELGSKLQKELDNLKSKLSRNTVTDVQIKPIGQRVLESPDYEKLMRKYRDLIMSDEIADSISQATKVGGEDKARMIVNALTKGTDWAENASVNGGESAFAIYTRHFFGNHGTEGIPEAPNFSFVNKQELDELTEAITDIKNNAEELVDTASQTATEGKKHFLSFLGDMSKGNKIFMGVGAAAAVGLGIWALVSNKNKKKAAEEEQANAAEYTPTPVAPAPVVQTAPAPAAAPAPIVQPAPTPVVAAQPQIVQTQPVQTAQTTAINPNPFSDYFVKTA